MCLDKEISTHARKESIGTDSRRDCGSTAVRYMHIPTHRFRWGTKRLFSLLFFELFSWPTSRSTRTRVSLSLAHNSFLEIAKKDGENSSLLIPNETFLYSSIVQSFQCYSSKMLVTVSGLFKKKRLRPTKLKLRASSVCLCSMFPGSLGALPFAIYEILFFLLSFALLSTVYLLNFFFDAPHHV